MTSRDTSTFYIHTVNELLLSEALRQHYVLNPQFTVWNGYKSDIAQKLVRAHDISHLVFGCDTSLLGEMRVQLWAKFGVQSFGFKESLSYAKDKEAKVLLKNPVGYWSMLVFFLRHFSEVFQVRRQAKFMLRRWVYFNENTYMQMTVRDIRQQFGIRVIAT